jgi:Flp pilus assembly protein TadG
VKREGRAWQRGQSVVELAIVTPFLVFLLLGTVEIGNAYNSYLTLVNASREGARLGARGNIFSSSELLQVVEQHSSGLSLATNGTVIYTVVTADPTATPTFQVTSTKLLNNGGSSHFTAAGLQTLEQQLTTTGIAAPYSGYLSKEKFVIVELIYTHHTLFNVGAFLSLDPIPMYAYTVMPVSAAS